MFIDIAAALAGFMLPFSWVAGLAADWLPSLRFEWRDYLMTWEYEEHRPHFWSSFAAGLVLGVAVTMVAAAKLLGFALE